MRFNWCDGDGTVLTEVYVSNDRKTVSVVNHAEWALDNAFGLKPIEKITWDDVYRFFQTRTYGENRVNLGALLENMGLNHYDPVAMCQWNQGRKSSDNKYIDFL